MESCKRREPQGIFSGNYEDYKADGPNNKANLPEYSVTRPPVAMRIRQENAQGDAVC